MREMDPQNSRIEVDMKKAGAAFRIEQPKPLIPTATPLPDSHPTPWIHDCHPHKVQW